MLEKELLLQNQITEILLSYGIPVNTKGFHYMRMAINMLYDNYSALQQIYKIYSQIAAQENTRPESVDRCIRHSIKGAFESGALTLQNKNAKNKQPKNVQVLTFLMQQLFDKIANNAKALQNFKAS